MSTKDTSFEAAMKVFKLDTSALEEAKRCVCGHREQDYGTPEGNFQKIGDLWSIYLDCNVKIDANDVAAMMALLKIAGREP